MPKAAYRVNCLILGKFLFNINGGFLEALCLKQYDGGSLSKGGRRERRFPGRLGEIFRQFLVVPMWLPI